METPPSRRLPGLPAALLVLAVLLGVLFRQSFSPAYVHFSNDGPLGIISSAASEMPTAMKGVWADLNWIGANPPAANPNVSAAIWTALNSPVGFAKFFAPVSLLLLGASAAWCFRRLGFQGPVALLGGIAAALNSNLLSHACWGLPTRALAVACVFVALGLLLAPPGRLQWLRAALAGFAIGLNVTEAADTGALLSLYVAAAVAVDFLGDRARPLVRRLSAGAATLAVVALAAAWIAFSALHTLFLTSVQGVAATAETQSDAARWEFITGWSFPKAEVVRFAIPGILGYRMDTPDGGAYWGGVGPDGDPRNRFSGGGEYAGVLVLVVAAWAVVRALAKGTASPFSDRERRRVLFWAVAALVSVLFAFGRHAPFYHLLFPLPFFRTMRIPLKFLHGFHLSVLVLFAHGLEAIARDHLARAGAAAGGWMDRLRAWWRAANTPRPEKRFVTGLAIALGASLLGGLVYLSYQPNLSLYLAPLVGKDAALVVARHSLGEVGVYVAFLAASSLAVALAFSGAWSGSRARTGWWILGVLLAADLYRADTPWIVHYDYQRRYQRNAVIDFLADNPAESRVACRVLPTTRQMLVPPDDGMMPAVHNLWLEHHFQRYNVQTVDIIQAPRMPALDEAYLRRFEPRTNETDYRVVGRFWQLTATRYVMAARGYEAQLNQMFAAPGTRFVPRLGFDLGLKRDVNPNDPQHRIGADDIDAEPNPNGRYALFEIAGALPRVGLFARWETSANDDATLARLRDPAFDPTSTLLLAQAPAGFAPAPGATNGTARIASYAPKRIVVKTDSPAPSMLLDNDRWHPDWHVTVDGHPAELLRANHLMRAVPVPAGAHTVEFRFEPDARPLWVSVSAVAAALALAGFLAVDARRNPAPRA